MSIDVSRERSRFREPKTERPTTVAQFSHVCQYMPDGGARFLFRCVDDGRGVGADDRLGGLEGTLGGLEPGKEAGAPVVPAGSVSRLSAKVSAALQK